MRVMNEMSIKRNKRARLVLSLLLAMSVVLVSAVPVFASGDVAGAIEGTWNAARGQIEAIVNNVVFPVIDMILAILFFVKLATSYFDYRKHGQFDFSATRF